MIIELDQYKYELSQKEQALKDLGASLDLENKKKRIAELDRMMEEPDFWTDPEKANQYSTEDRRLKDDVKGYEDLAQSYEDIGALIEMAQEEEDQDSVAEVKAMLDEFTERLDQMSTKLLLSGEYDSMNAILRLNAGAGGTESNDWAGMLYRMYTRWAERHGFTIKVLDYLEGDEAGIKSVTIEIDGEYAYGYLRSEAGVHRLVRISPFNAQAKRQTSFVSCDVMPLISRFARRISRWRFSVHPVPVDSTSTRRRPQYVSSIFRRASWWPARRSVHSCRTGTRPCRC